MKLSTQKKIEAKAEELLDMVRKSYIKGSQREDFDQDHAKDAIKDALTSIATCARTEVMEDMHQLEFSYVITDEMIKHGIASLEQLDAESKSAGFSQIAEEILRRKLYWMGSPKSDVGAVKKFRVYVWKRDIKPLV